MRNKLLFVLFGFILTTGFAYAADDSTQFQVRRYDVRDKSPNVSVERFIADDLKPLGKVKGSFVGAALLRNDDLVYLELKNKSVSVGDRLTVLEDRGGVSIPGKFGRSIGKDIQVKGYVEIVKVMANAVIGKIYNASQQIRIGDVVTELMEINVELKPQEPQKMIRGKILASSNHTGLITPYELAYIDRGGEDGLRVNDRLYVYKTAESEHEVDPNLPPINIAELVVVNTGNRVATVYVVSAKDQFGAGSFFKSAISDVRFLDSSATLSSVDANNGQVALAQPNYDTVEETEYLDSVVDKSYLTVGPGLSMAIRKDGVHRPYFSILVEPGTQYWSVPLIYTARDENNHEFAGAFTLQYPWQPFRSHPRLFLVPKAGPTVNFESLKVANERVNITSLGLKLGGEVRWIANERFFFSWVPYSIDVVFWQHNSVDGAEVDLSGVGRMFLSIGFLF